MPRDSRSELSVDIGAGASMHQKVMAELGVAHSTETRFVVAVAWHAEGRERLFPRFNGELELAESAEACLWCSTVFAPCRSVRLAGRRCCRRLATGRRSLRELLKRLACRLESEMERRDDRAARPSPPELVAPTEWERSEIYIG
jgi:hypothetical protein